MDLITILGDLNEDPPQIRRQVKHPSLVKANFSLLLDKTAMATRNANQGLDTLATSSNRPTRLTGWKRLKSGMT